MHENCSRRFTWSFQQAMPTTVPFSTPWGVVLNSVVRDNLVAQAKEHTLSCQEEKGSIPALVVNSQEAEIA